ncbi:MAG TPA: ABC transporter permease, partial [Cytophagales bacterium]|nr:ABC transporter permease [Cytophagales bacterium]
FEWEGKDPNFHPHMATNWVSAEFGSTVGWNIFEGRDFSKELVTDSSSVVINQAAVTYMGLEQPVGQEFTLWVRNSYRTFKIIGVTRNIIRESPYSQVRPMVYFLDTEETELEYYLLKLNPELPSQEAIASTTQVFEQLAPNVPFDYQFVDDRYAQKFEAEVKVGKLSGVFAGLAIMISCLGLFGLASYMAEQRTKEIGIRKVLGASIMTLWKLLSSEFILLVVLSCALAIPIAYYFISDWLANYEYRIDIPWYSFLLAIVGALVITLITVSFQSVKAALVNPIKSLRSE